jgi:hypothetical protein
VDLILFEVSDGTLPKDKQVSTEEDKEIIGLLP